MNYHQTITLLSWETRSARRHAKAVAICKDYNLKPIHRTLYIGSLYFKERSSLYSKCIKLFNRKTDKMVLMITCQSCFEDALIDDTIKEYAKVKKDFEFVQIPEKPIK